MKTMAKAVVALLTLVLLAACGGGGGGGNDSSAAAPGQAIAGDEAQIANPSVIVQMFGDSTTWGGTALAKSGSEPAWLQTMVPAGVLVDNEGVGGTTATELLNGTDGAHEPFAQVMAASRANIVTINFAMNDVVYSTADRFTADLGSLVDIAKSYGKQVVLQEPNPSCATERVNLPQFVAIVDSVATAKGVPVVKQYGAYADWQAHEPDCTHPDSTYYQVKAQNTYATLAPLIAQMLGSGAGNP